MRAFVISLAAALALVSMLSTASAQDSGQGLGKTAKVEPLAILSELGLVPDTDAAGPTSVAALSEREVFAECCKICRKGKACGDSCIDRTETCEQPPGCACDGE